MLDQYHLCLVDGNIVLDRHRMDHFIHLFSIDNTVLEEECQEKYILHKPSIINASAVFSLTFFLTFFFSTYPTILFYYIHLLQKNFIKLLSSVV